MKLAVALSETPTWMKRHRLRVVLVGLGAVLIIGIGLTWTDWSSGRVELSFLSLTNDVQMGVVGVFRLQNDSKDALHVTGISYEQQTADGWVEHVGDYGADFGADPLILPGADTAFRVWVPTGEGPYRLVLQCEPERSIAVRVPYRVWLGRLVLLLNDSHRLYQRIAHRARFPKSAPINIGTTEDGQP